MTLTCPHCHSDEQLYLVERAEILYPINATQTDGGARAVDYSMERDRRVLDENTVPIAITCGGCDWTAGPHHEHIPVQAELLAQLAEPEQEDEYEDENA